MQLHTFFWPKPVPYAVHAVGYVIPSGRPEMCVVTMTRASPGLGYRLTIAQKLVPDEKVCRVKINSGRCATPLFCPPVSADAVIYEIRNGNRPELPVHTTLTGRGSVRALHQLCRLRLTDGTTLGGVTFDESETTTVRDRFYSGLIWDEKEGLHQGGSLITTVNQPVDRVPVAAGMLHHFLFGMTRYRLWALSVDQELCTENDPGEQYRPIVYRHGMFPIPLREKDNRTSYFVLPGPNGQPGAWERVYTAAVTEQQAIFVSFKYQQDMTVRLRRFRLDPVRKVAHPLDDLVFPIGSPPNGFMTNRTSIHLTPDELVATVFIPAGNFRAQKVKRNGDLSKYAGKVAAVSLTVDLE